MVCNRRRLPLTLFSGGSRRRRSAGLSRSRARRRGRQVPSARQRRLCREDRQGRLRDRLREINAALGAAGRHLFWIASRAPRQPGSCAYRIAAGVEQLALYLLSWRVRREVERRGNGSSNVRLHGDMLDQRRNERMAQRLLSS